MEYVPAFMLTPRPVLSLGEVFAHDLRSRCGSYIDTAFDLTSSSEHSAVTSTLMFADDG